MFLRNVSIYLRVLTASQPKRLTSSACNMFMRLSFKLSVISVCTNFSVGHEVEPLNPQTNKQTNKHIAGLLLLLNKLSFATGQIGVVQYSRLY
jgi:hypothetical protein